MNSFRKYLLKHLHNSALLCTFAPLSHSNGIANQTGWLRTLNDASLAQLARARDL